MKHETVQANGARFHVASLGAGPPLLLLHGWPEYWRTWEPVMERLADRFTLIAPDLRGFGDSDKPRGQPQTPWGGKDHAADMAALLDALHIGRAGVVGHDVGGAVMQPLARAHPDRLAGLFFFDFSYPGIGPRMGQPERLREIWYQSFHLMDFAPALIGSSREACRLYLDYILRHWSYRQDWVDAMLEDWVDTYLKPGNLEGGFAFYKAANADRLRMMRGEAAALPPIATPTCVRWAAHDPLFPPAWTDRLGDTFSTLDLGILEDVGHFPHREDPDRAAAEIARFFTTGAAW
ncbi:MAG: alpha/beta fold hydrolase [Janthinobacterium lividum]